MDYGLGKLDYGTQNFVKIGFSFLRKKFWLAATTRFFYIYVEDVISDEILYIEQFYGS